jgi:DNA-binding SARP family transcriptional activator/tetratricopeptide (TPR) repeat protein
LHRAPPASFRTLYLRTLGGLSVEGEASEAAIPPLGPRPLALLAVVAAAGTRGISREKILGILWAESDEEQGRHTLSQTRYRLRRETGAAWITGTTQLRLDPAVTSDVVEFDAALNSGQLERAAAVYTGPFLEGFYLAGAPEFEQWVEETRSRLQFAAQKALETLARRAVEAGSFTQAVKWWYRLGELDPLDATYAAGRIRALMGTDDHAGALRFAHEYSARVRHELEVEPEPVIAELTTRLRSMPAAMAIAPPRPAPIAVTVEPVPEAPLSLPPPPGPRRRILIPTLVLSAVAVAVAAWQIGGSRPRSVPFLAVSSIESRDSTALGPVLRDMLATNLARVSGMQVVSNSRLVELLPRSPGSADATTDAARRAGASEIVEGELEATTSGLVLTLRRVAIRTGIVEQGYTVRGRDLYALADSATAAIARDLQLAPPADPVATVRTSSAVAYALYEQGLRAYSQADHVAAIRLMSAALERDSTFAMAAAYAWRSSLAANRTDDADRLLPMVQRLATRVTDRERLWLEAMIAQYAGAPLTELLRVARQLTDRFPNDPDGQLVVGHAAAATGDFAGAVEAFEHMVAIDSVAGAPRGPYCRVCVALYAKAEAYAWWDSLPAAERTARRLLTLRPDDESVNSGMLVEILLRLRRRSEAEAAIATARRSNRGTVLDYSSVLDRDLIRVGRLEELQARLALTLPGVAADARGEMPWLLAFTLRNQGRARAARALAADGVVPGSAARLVGHQDAITLAIAALEAGQPDEAARRFLAMAAVDRTQTEGAGFRARQLAWHLTLAATALAAAGDTAAVRALADSVEHIGAYSSFGRDYRLHHFLHGLLLQQQNRHDEAVARFRRSVFSLTDGYTRINLELARSLVTLRRHGEAIAVLQPALRGGVDGGNTYVTHTELHEALAHAFYAAGQRDSARAHYATVERAWRAADPNFAARYRTARDRAMQLHVRQ